MEKVTVKPQTGVGLLQRRLQIEKTGRQRRKKSASWGVVAASASLCLQHTKHGSEHNSCSVPCRWRLRDWTTFSVQPQLSPFLSGLSFPCGMTVTSLSGGLSRLSADTAPAGRRTCCAGIRWRAKAAGTAQDSGLTSCAIAAECRGCAGWERAWARGTGPVPRAAGSGQGSRAWTGWGWWGWWEARRRGPRSRPPWVLGGSLLLRETPPGSACEEQK